MSRVPFFPADDAPTCPWIPVETFISLVIGGCTRCPRCVGADKGESCLSSGGYSSSKCVTIYKECMYSIKQRNQPALTKLSPTASLVPDLTHENDNKVFTGRKAGVIFIVEI